MLDGYIPVPQHGHSNRNNGTKFDTNECLCADAHLCHNRAKIVEAAGRSLVQNERFCVGACLCHFGGIRFEAVG